MIDSSGGRTTGRSRTGTCLAMFLLLRWTGESLAAEFQVDLASFIKDTQKMSPKAREMEIVWWIPDEYWQVSLGQDPNVSSAQIQEVVEAVRHYALVAVVKGTLGVFGGATFESEADIRARIRIRDKQGRLCSPLRSEETSPDVINLLTVIKPLLTNVMGPVGQNMHFFLFSALDEKGQRIAEAKKEGAFTVVLGNNEYKWRLPLGSLLPPKTCPECGEKLNGAYSFCPYDGTDLPKTGR